MEKRRNTQKWWGIFCLVAPVASLFLVITGFGLVYFFEVLYGIEFSTLQSLVFPILTTVSLVACFFGVPLGIILLVLSKDKK